MAVLRPDWRDLPRNRSVLRTLVKLAGTQFEGRNVTQVGCNCDGFAGIRIGHLDASLIFGKEVGEGKIKPKVCSTAQKELVEVESLMGRGPWLAMCLSKEAIACPRKRLHVVLAVAVVGPRAAAG